MDEDALDADTGLASVGESARGDEGNGVLEKGIGVDDDGGVSAEFEGEAFFCGERLERPTDIGASRERDHFDAGIGDEEGGMLIGADDEIGLAWRRAGFVEDLGVEAGGEGGFGGRFDDDRVAGGEGGSDFVGDEIEGEIERGDRGDHPDGEALGEAEVTVTGGVGVEGEEFAVGASGFFRGDGESDDGAVDLGFGEDDGFA